MNSSRPSISRATPKFGQNTIVRNKTTNVKKKKIERPIAVGPPLDKDGKVMMRVGDKQFISEFDPTTDLQSGKYGGRRVAIIGSSGCGKSSACKDFMRATQNIPYWLIVSPSETGNGNFGKLVGSPAQIHTQLSLATIAIIKKRQEWVHANWHIEGTENPKEYISDPSAAVVLDDISEDEKLLGKEAFKWLWFTSRNFNLLVILIIQYIRMLPKPVRTAGLSHVVLFKQEREWYSTLHKEFAGCFGKKEEPFAQALELITEVDQRCMVIKKYVTSNKIEEKIFYWQATPVHLSPNFTVGSVQTNNMIRKHFDKEKYEKVKSGAMDEINQIISGKSKSKSAESKKKDPEKLEFILI